MKAAKGILKQNAENFENSKKHLFGSDFKDVLKSAAKDSKDASTYFGQKNKKSSNKSKQPPFRTGSFKRGDSSAGRGKPMFKRTNQQASSSNSNYNNTGKGKRKFFPQTGRTIKSTGKFNKCTPFAKKHIPIKKPIQFVRGKDKTLPIKLGKVNNRQRSLKHCERL